MNEAANESTWNEAANESAWNEATHENLGMRLPAREPGYIQKPGNEAAHKRAWE